MPEHGHQRADAGTPGHQQQRAADVCRPHEIAADRAAQLELSVGDQLELRGPIGGYFVWSTDVGGPLLLVAGGSGICPLMAMLRHRAARWSSVPARLLYSSRSLEDVIYRQELDQLAERMDGLEVFYTLT